MITKPINKVSTLSLFCKRRYVHYCIQIKLTAQLNQARRHGRLSRPIPSLQAEGGRVHGVLRLLSGATVGELMGMGPTWATNRTESHNPTGLLRLLLASIVHHSVWITLVCLVFPDYPFHGLALFTCSEKLLAHYCNKFSVFRIIHVNYR